VRDVSCSDPVVNLASWSFDDPNYEWVDPHVLDIPTCFRGPTALDVFLSKVSILKPNAPSNAVVGDSYNNTNRVCHG